MKTCCLWLLSKRKNVTLPLPYCVVVFFCGAKGDLRSFSNSVSKQGKQCIIGVVNEREKFNDEASYSIINKILLNNRGDIINYKYHHNCYSSFTDKGKIERIKRKETVTAEKERAIAEKEQLGKVKLSMCSCRKNSIDWNLCMFCQGQDVKNIQC